jgi:Ca2+-binding EF-hand superfamily protein
MCTANRAVSVAAICLGWFIGPASIHGQSPAVLEITVKEKKPKPPPDEFKAILGAIEDAYKAPREVDKDVLDELRKQYRDPKPDRESKIFREIRRLYYTTPEQEESILSEIRRSYAQPSAEQEERIFQAIRRYGQLPLGAVPGIVQTELAAKLFGKFDRNGDSILDESEMSETLRARRGEWDGDRDGVISFAEFTPYYQMHFKSLADQVAAGEIPLKTPVGTFVPEAAPVLDEHPRRLEIRTNKSAEAADLPDWFADFDLDSDGQVGLYEWRKKGKSIAEFLAMDLNQDGYIEAKELQQVMK